MSWQERVEFRRVLLGIQSERHRWSQCVEWTNKKMGMAVGALFIRDNFDHESKVSVSVRIKINWLADAKLFGNL